MADFRAQLRDGLRDPKPSSEEPDEYNNGDWDAFWEKLKEYSDEDSDASSEKLEEYSDGDSDAPSLDGQPGVQVMVNQQTNEAETEHLKDGISLGAVSRLIHLRNEPPFTCHFRAWLSVPR